MVGTRVGRVITRPVSDATAVALAVLRYAVLAAGTAAMARVLASQTSVTSAWCVAVAIAFAFLAGLRWHVMRAHLFGGTAKSLTWSGGLVAALAVGAFGAKAAGIGHWLLPATACMTELLAFYAVGKLTCAISGCCGSARVPRPPLAVLETGFSALLVTLGTGMIARGEVAAALGVMVGGHLCTRVVSRWLRTERLSSAFAADTLMLVAVLAAIPILR